MNKQILTLLILLSINLLYAKPGDGFNGLSNWELSKSKQYFHYKLDSVITEYYSSENNFSLFNDNVNFSTKRHTYNSLLKMGGEALTGGILGFALGSVMYNTLKPKIKGEGETIGKLIQFSFTSAAAIIGIINGVYYSGKLFGDEGKRKNMGFWMILSGLAAYGLSQAFTSNKESRLWISIASMPIGAAFGFNTNDISEWIFPDN